MNRFLLILLLVVLTACSSTASAGQQSVLTQAPPTEEPPSQSSLPEAPVTEEPAAAPEPTQPPTEPTSPPAVAPTAGEPAAPTAPATEAAPKPTAPAPTLGPVAWQELPVIPMVGDTPVEIYQRGLALGNNPASFSKIGDCGSTPAWFLGDFDRGPEYYRLGEHTDLEPMIQAFQGSFDRTSLAAKAGFNASSILTPLWANPEFCQPNETPLACEYRVNRPVMALIMLGTNDVFHPDKFEPQMRHIIELSIENGVIPILSTKADNEEGDGSINATIARLALEYDIPLWNFWRAVQELPDGGLQEDGVHLTWAGNRFDDPRAMEKAWPVRNLTALQTLDAVWRAVTAP